MHRRVSLSAISTVSWALDEDLDFYADAGITNVGVSVAKLDRFGWDEGIRRVVDAGLRVTNLIGLGPFDLARPGRWESQRERLGRALDAAAEAGAECLVFTTGPAGALLWEDAAGVDRLRLVQVSDFAVGTLSTPNRLVPGDGDIPLERILGQVLAAGYEGAFDLELIGPRIEEEGYRSACRRSIDQLGDMLDTLGA